MNNLEKILIKRYTIMLKYHFFFKNLIVFLMKSLLSCCLYPNTQIILSSIFEKCWIKIRLLDKNVFFYEHFTAIYVISVSILRSHVLPLVCWISFYLHFFKLKCMMFSLGLLENQLQESSNHNR